MKKENRFIILKIITIIFLSLQVGFSYSQDSEFSFFDEAVKDQVPEWKAYSSYKDFAERQSLLDKVIALNMVGKKINTFPVEILDCKNLESLDLSSNQLTEIPNKIIQLEKLSYFSISYNDIAEVPEELGGLKNLLELRIHSNLRLNLLSLFSAFAGFEKKLAFSTVSNDVGNQSPDELMIIIPRIKAIPKEMCRLKNISLLIFNNNELTSLPSEFCELTNLKELYIQFNKFTSIPNEVLCLKSLERLNIAYNELEQLPKDLSKLKSLKQIRIYNNKHLSFTNDFNGFSDIGKTIVFSRNPWDINYSSDTLVISLDEDFTYSKIIKFVDNEYIPWTMHDVELCKFNHNDSLAKKLMDRILYQKQKYELQALAHAYILDSQFDKAIETAELSISLGDSDNKVFSSLGLAYLCKGNFEKAEEILLNNMQNNKNSYEPANIIYQKDIDELIEVDVLSEEHQAVIRIRKLLDL